ncbi:hypothetical protein [Corynebacterium callunae]|uniref:hypothetical protein n=1 Tax=Corynebacterium callunae TaxID=1721 RepID=UPI001FFFE022|nr:hypothetical protein [Corynebacterium callunae]MCK2200499.1 hypothetical protein [Corynebacterium callunae]
MTEFLGYLPEEQRFTEAVNDTGESHVLVGRQYIVKSAWTDGIFYAPTKREAMEKFRAYEQEMFKKANKLEGHND